MTTATKGKRTALTNTRTTITMSHPYPFLSSHTTGQTLNGSFDEYDSIDGVFSIVADGDDVSSMVSSMNMSEMSSSVQDPTGQTNQTNQGDRGGGVATAHSRGGGEVGGRGEIIHDTTNTQNAIHASVQVAEGDLLGIDASDFSAILGVSTDHFQEDDTVYYSHSVDSESAPPLEKNASNPKKLSRNLEHFEPGNSREYGKDSSYQSDKRNITLGPLGDELSYAQSNPYDNDSTFYSDVESDGLESGMSDGLLPDWISSSSRRTKTVLVASAALVMGSLVLAVIAFGMSGDGTSSALSNSTVMESASVLKDRVNNPTGGTLEVADTEEGALGLPSLPTYHTDSATGAPFATPETQKMTDSPVLSTTGEVPLVLPTPPTGMPTRITKTPTTSSPTSMPTSPPTSSSPTTSSPTTSPTSSPTVTNSPTITPTTKPSSFPSNHPSLSPSDKPTFNPTIVPSAQPSGTPSITSSPTTTLSSEPSSAPPTIYPTLTPSTRSPSKQPSHHPSSQPSTSPSFEPSSSNPTYSPSVASPTLPPTTSLSPSWSFGEQAITEGRSTFYLMADGGTNVEYWTERLSSLDDGKNGPKFLVHLGSAVRTVDNCAEEAYLNVQSSLSNVPVPVYSVPGTKDFRSCDNPAAGWERYQQHILPIDTLFWDVPTDYVVKRQPQHQENFAFLWQKVLFIGIHLTANSDVGETSSIIRDDLDWIKENVNYYYDELDVIFVMGNGRLKADGNVPFYNNLIYTKENEWPGKLFIYARRSNSLGITKDVGGVTDFHVLKVGNGWPILDVQIETGGKDNVPKLKFRNVKDDFN